MTDHPLALVLGDLANPLQTSFELREFLVRSLDTAGNAYARIERNGRGQVEALWPLPASSVQVERLESGRLRYRVTQPGSRGPAVLLQEEVLHIRNASDDGLMGISPIARARGALGLAVEQASAATDLVTNNLRAQGIVMHPGQLSAEAIRNISEGVTRQDRKGRVLVFEEGMKWVQTSFSSEDAELLESRKLSNHDVAHIFSIHPAVLGLSESVAYASAEQAARDLVQNTLQPLAERVEQAFMRCLLTTEGRRKFVIEHDLRGLLRGNMAERFAAYRVGREIGVYSANDIRRIENEPAIEGGDSYLQPVTLAGSSAPQGGGANNG